MKNQTKNNNQDFFYKVYLVVAKIPNGRVTTYGAIAKYLGSAKSARIVGWALNNSHNQENYIPAHRVVNRNGLLTGKHHFGNTNTMEQLLMNEGIVVCQDVVQDFEKHFWDPEIEL